MNHIQNPCYTLDPMPTCSLRILVLEDNDDLRNGWLSFFQAQGHSVIALTLAEELLDELGQFSPNVYVIDLNLPDADGLAVVRRLRGVHPNSVIVVTTARTEIGDRVQGYENGADIYFTKPVNPQELMAGISALAMRRQAEGRQVSTLILKLSQHQLKGSEVAVSLTPLETALLASLVRAAGQPLERWQISHHLGLGSELMADAVLEMRVARLRKKLAAAGAQAPSIRAVYGRGYLLCCAVVLE
jgi:DNA-binding response OmpR family regulator